MRKIYDRTDYKQHLYFYRRYSRGIVFTFCSAAHERQSAFNFWDYYSLSRNCTYGKSVEFSSGGFVHYHWCVMRGNFLCGIWGNKISALCFGKKQKDKKSERRADSGAYYADIRILFQQYGNFRFH